MRITHLTSNGNLLSADTNISGGIPAFYKPNGDFLRLVSWEEYEFLIAELTEIVIQPHTKQVDFEAPVMWEYLWKTKHDDFSSWKAGTCNNGGDYSFSITSRYYARKTRNGWQFLCVDIHSTSAEFPYDEIKGGFQYNLRTVGVIGCDQDFDVLTQWDHAHVVIDHIGNLCPLPFGALDSTHDPYNEDYPMDQATIQVSLSTLKQRALSLREIGFTRPNASQRRKSKRPQNNRLRR